MISLNKISITWPGGAQHPVTDFLSRMHMQRILDDVVRFSGSSVIVFDPLLSLYPADFGSIARNNEYETSPTVFYYIAFYGGYLILIQ